MTEFKNLVSAAWLKGALSNDNLKVVDASWYLPAQNRDAKSEFEAAHIPGAVFFDLDEVSDRSSPYPHMMPTEDAFGLAMSSLGLSNKDQIVVYDGLGLFSAPRLWWMLRTFGHQDVALLAGGFPAWTAINGPTEGGWTDVQPAEFKAELNSKNVADWTEIRDELGSGTRQIIDARSADRFSGSAPEPRAGLRSGHIPGAHNLAFQDLLSDGGLKTAEELRRAFNNAGIDLQKPITTSCGSGVTAAVLTLALDELGVEDKKLYDGSWAEWGLREETADLIET